MAELRVFDRRRVPIELWLAGAIVSAGALFLARPHALLPAFGCPFRAITGLPCVTCGGTRAFELLASGELVGAVVMNPLAVAVVLGAIAFVIYAIALVVFALAPVRPDFRRGPALFVLRFGSLFAISANWIYVVLAGR